jgi:cell surface protein SprA
VAQTTQVLEMQFTPADTVSVVGGKSLNPWGGIMRALSPGFFDQTEAKFLEVTMRVVSADSTGKMHIELGQISEDIIPNGGTQPNTEDFQGGQRNGILDDNEDVGLDGVRGNDSAPNFSLDGNGRDFWDVNRNRQHDWGEPASDDDWAYVSGSNDFRFINGTENSRNEEGGPRPDTEDINGNGGLDLSNKYFSYLIELDPTKPNKDKSATNPETGWFLYRLPLNEIETTIKQGGDPSFTLIEYVRIWVEGKKPIFLQIADISMVSNEWKEIGIGEAEVDLSGYKKDPRFEVSIINTEENPGEYQSPPGVQREEDLITKVLAKEQSQVLRVTNVGKDSIVVAQKTFFQPLNLINYNDLKMFVYGRDDGSHMQFANHPDSSAIEFFIRFGADERNFYEFRERVFRGWDERNEMDVDLIELTSLKPPLSRNDGLVPGLQDTTYYYKKISNKKGTRTQELRIRGIPSLTNVRTLIAGVKNLSSTPFSGEIWMDELRVAGVKKDKGMAMRVRADLKLADFMTINGELNRQDADFHNVSERFGRGDNRLSFTLSGNMTFDKMLPESWGLNVPLSMNYTKSEATPKYFPGRDIQVTNDLKPHELEQIQSLNNQFGFNFSVRRRAKSQNFFLKNTIDNLSGSLSYTKNSLSNSQIKHSNRVAWSGDLGYNLSFGQKNFIKPFAWIGKAPIVGKLTDTKLYYLPQNFDTRLQATDSKDSSETRVIDSRTGLTTRGVRSKTRSYTSVLTYRTSMKLVESMSLDFSRSFTNDMLSKARRDPKLRAQGIFGLLTGNYDNVNANQSFSTRYSPNVLSWLNTNFNYTSNFRYTNNIQQRVIGRSAGTNASFTASATLRFSQLFQSLKSRGPSSSGETSGRTRQAPRLPPGDQPRTEEGEEDVPVKPPEGQPSQERKPPGEPSKEKQEPKKPAPKREEGKSGRSISLLDFFGKFKDISFNFSRRKNYSNNALDSTGTPSLAYQFGLTRDPGVPTVSNITTTPSVFQRVDNYSVQTGFDISRSFNVQLRFDHDEQSNVSTTKTGSTSDSWLGSKEYRIPFLPQEGIPFPEWTITWSGLERLKPFNKIATSMSISHSFGGKKSKIWNGTPDQKTSEDFSFNFKPLLKVNLSWKNGMISSFQYNKTTGEKPTYSPLDPNIEQSNSFTRNTDISLTTTYSKRSGFRVPLPFLKNKELKNSIDLSITFLKGSSKSSLQRGQGSEKISANETERWSFSPRMTYSFSNRVRGGVNFEYGKTKSKLSGTTTIKELGIDINISIRGD